MDHNKKICGCRIEQSKHQIMEEFYPIFVFNLNRLCKLNLLYIDKNTRNVEFEYKQEKGFTHYSINKLISSAWKIIFSIVKRMRKTNII